jgi:formylmethanofuran dehydrogenase subunit E
MQVKDSPMKYLKDVVKFHGHICPGLALGYRVSKFIVKEFGKKALDEEIVAIVENSSCAVDAIQVMTGCTFGKGNLIFKDYGKQVYTFVKRPSSNGIKISVHWKSPEETAKEKQMWERYMRGDRSKEVLRTVHKRKSKKIEAILKAEDKELFKIVKEKVNLPEEAVIYPSIPCALCGEKVMEPRARVKNGQIVCIPCQQST